MARSLKDIYLEARVSREKYLGTAQFANESKMSVIDAFTWATASCIWTLENLFDLFKVDIANLIQNRINGTPAYYINAIMKYQHGDQLQISEDGTRFSYPNQNESKRIISKATYSEVEETGFHDKKLHIKVAKSKDGQFTNLTQNELLGVRSYMRQIAFAGTHLYISSRPGDVLIPRVTVYHDGAVSNNEIYKGLEDSLTDMIKKTDFDSVVYAQHVVDALQAAPHVVDVYFDPAVSTGQGIFVAQYDDDNKLIPASIDQGGKVLSYEHRVARFFTPSSGFMRQSTKKDGESGIPAWRESIILKIEDGKQ